jgi:hypothetical protein
MTIVFCNILIDYTILYLIKKNANLNSTVYDTAVFSNTMNIYRSVII